MMRLLDHPRLVRELKLLERRPRVGGRRSDYPHGGHDDHPNALALAVALAAQERLRPFAGPVLREAWRSAYHAPWVSSAPSDSPWGHAPASVAAQPAI